MSNEGAPPRPPAPRGAPRRSRPWRTRGSRRRAPRSSSRTPSSRPSRPRPGPPPGSGRAALRTEPARRGRQRLERVRVQPDEQRPVADRDRRRHRAVGLAHGRLRRRRDLEVLRIRQAVADERRLERDDRPAVARGRRRPPGATTSRSVTAGEMGMSEAYRRRYPARHADARRPMTPEDIRRIVVVEELDLSADGRLAIVVRRTIRGDKYLGHLFAIDLATAATPRPRQAHVRRRPGHAGRACLPTAAPLAFVRTDPADDDAPAAIALSTSRGRTRRVRLRGPATTGPSASSPGRPMAAASRSRRRSTRPGSSSGRSRRSRPRRAKAQDRGRRDSRATRPPDRADRLALGRRGPPRSVVAPVRHRSAGRASRAR